MDYCGVRHNDLKPANILMTGNPPQAKICDFGLADALEVGTTKVR